MVEARLIPCLLLSEGALVKTIKFKSPKYIGDPINAIKIFNTKEVDELIILDIDSFNNRVSPNYELIKKIAEECFMPLCYGGGIKSIEEADVIFKLGVEKVAIQTAAIFNPDLISIRLPCSSPSSTLRDSTLLVFSLKTQTVLSASPVLIFS